jgi:hypothetical protein
MSDESTQSEIYLTVIGPEAVIRSLAARKDIPGVEVGMAQPIDGLADAVDSVLGPDEVRQLLELLTASLGVGAATLQFIEAMVSLMKTLDEAPAPVPPPTPLPPPPQIIILDARSNVIVRIDGNTDAAKALKQIENWSADDK